MNDSSAASRLHHQTPWPVYGHDWAVDHLRRALLHGRIRHAYLIVGTESIGKETLARAMAMALNCVHAEESARPCGQCRPCRLITSGSHPDVLYSELDGGSGMLRIEEARMMTQRLALKPYESRYRIGIFRDFDHARPQVQDALLKTLEEPPPQSLLILLAPSVESLLPTIVSRSQVIRLRPFSAAAIQTALVEGRGADPEHAELLARLSGGRIGWAIRALEDESILEQRGAALDLLERLLTLNRAERFELAEDLSKDKLGLVPLLELWQTYWRDVLLLCQGSAVVPANIDRRESLAALAQSLTVEEALTALQATRGLLDRLSANLNLRLAVEILLLEYPSLPSRR